MELIFIRFIFNFYFFSWKLLRENYVQRKVTSLMVRVVRMHTINATAMHVVHFKDISLNVQTDRYFQVFQDVANMLIAIQYATYLANGKTIPK